MACLKGDEADDGHEKSDEGKDLRADERPLDALEGLLAASQLGAPPDGSGGDRLGSGESGGTHALKRRGYQHKVGAGAALGGMVAQFTRSGKRPLAALDKLANVFFTVAGN